MPQSQLKCTRCQGKMEVGVVLDRGQGGERQRQNWVSGVPERSFWEGLKTRDLLKVPVLAYRCEKCGYLESYANLETKS